MSAAALTFDASSHTYRHRGVVVPSVTQCLSKLHDFAGIPESILTAAKERGTYVHKLCEYHDEGDLDPSSLGDYSGYLDAWIAFQRDRKAKWDRIEHSMFSARYGYAGTPDRRGWLEGVAYGSVDIKTAAGTLHRVSGMQAAAYRQLAAEEDPTGPWLLSRRATVQLRPNGTYLFREWSDPADWPAFLSLVNLIHWTSKAA